MKPNEPQGVSAVSVDRVGPGPFGQLVEGGPFPVGDRPANRELGGDGLIAQAADVGQERFRAAGSVRPDQDRDAVAVDIGDLRQRRVQDGDVIGGGVRAGVARPQQPARNSPELSQNARIGW